MTADPTRPPRNSPTNNDKRVDINIIEDKITNCLICLHVFVNIETEIRSNDTVYSMTVDCLKLEKCICFKTNTKYAECMSSIVQPPNDCPINNDKRNKEMIEDKTRVYCNGCVHLQMKCDSNTNYAPLYKCDRTNTVVAYGYGSGYWMIAVPNNCPLNAKGSNIRISEWEELKKKGSAHYRSGDIQPIDLIKNVKPHESLTALQIKALTDDIKYAFRMLTKGANISDCDKIIHYTEMTKVILNERTKNE